MTELLDTIENLGISTWVRESPSKFAYPTVLLLHVIVDLLIGTPSEVWNVFTHLASRLPRRVRLVVHNTPDSKFTRSFALETTTGRPLSHVPRTSLVTN